MNGSYQLQSFTRNKGCEVTRLKAQVELFFDKEFDLYRKNTSGTTGKPKGVKVPLRSLNKK